MFMEFLYFPEDKTEYIPAFIILVIFMVMALATMYFFYKKSKKEEEKVNKKYHLGEYTLDSNQEKENDNKI